MLKTLMLSAAAAGLAAGLFIAALQQVTTTPLILEAERYEQSANAAAAADDSAVSLGTHDHAASGAQALTSGGVERALLTAASTVVMAFGFSLALLGAMVLSGRAIDGRAGLAFGAAGFAAAALAPALGLAPEIPGSAGAAVADGQIWWFATAATTAIGLAGLLLGRSAMLRMAGLALIAAPHLIGAPQAEVYASTAPAELAGRFAAASLAVGAVFWAVLGFASGAAYERLARSQ